MQKFPKLRSLPTYQKRILIALAILLGLFLIAQILISLFLDPYLGKKLASKFHESTKRAYVLEFEDLDLSILGRKITVENISIYPDSSKLDSSGSWNSIPVWGQFQAGNFSIQGVKILNLLINKKLDIKAIELTDPNVLVGSIQTKQKDDTSSSKQNLNLKIYEAINTRLKSLSIDQIEITGASLDIRNNDGKQGLFALKNGTLLLQDVVFDSSSAQKQRFFITDKLAWNAQKVSWNLPNNLYTLKAKTIGGSSFNKNAFVDSLRLEPIYPKYEFSKTVGREIDRIDLLIEHMEIQNFNFDSLLYSRKLIAKIFEIDNAKLEIFRDKRLPGGPTTVKPLPHLAFKDVNIPVRIDTISITGSFISYAEHKPQVSGPGAVTFEELQATFSNVSNFTSESGKSQPITLDAKTKVMGSGLLSTNFSFSLIDTSGRHSIYGKMDSMSVTDLNPILENVGFVHADDGFINALKFSMKLDKRTATGTLTLDYRNLKIKMLEKSKMEEGETKELTTFIANTFVIKKNNTEKPLRNGRIEFERIEEKSVFNYWWKSLLSGLKDNIGL